MPDATCAVTGCEKPRRKREWCDNHYQRWRRTGDASTPPQIVWAEPGGCCIVCGDPNLRPKSRRFCSAACQQRDARARREAPVREPIEPLIDKPCTQCGDLIRVMTPGRTRKVRTDIQRCRECRAQRQKHGITAKELARRDGVNCAICGEAVDFTIKAPNKLSPSIDRIVPAAKGGTNEPSNLQLAHRWCNQVKFTRPGWVMP